MCSRAGAVHLLCEVRSRTQGLFERVRSVVRDSLKAKRESGELGASGLNSKVFVRIWRQNEIFLRYYQTQQILFVDSVLARNDRITVADLSVAMVLLARLARISDRSPTCL